MTRNLQALMDGFSVGRQHVVDFANAGAQNYAEQMGLQRPEHYDRVFVNLPQAHRIAGQYLAAPEYDKAAEPHYRQLGEEVGRQFDYMTRPIHKGGMGLSVEVTKEDPYTRPSRKPGATHEVPDPAGLFNDLRENRRVKVLSTESTGGHPFFTNEQNDMFRAVHDVFGHSATGRAFDPHGEEAAFQSHYAMFSPMARPAMASETRGQNSANNYGGLPRGEFAQQKVVTSPDWQRINRPGRRASMHAGMSDALAKHRTALPNGFLI